MKNRFLAFSVAIVSLSILGSFTAPALFAQARPALVQDADQAARAPFSASVDLVWSEHEDNAVVQIPAGYRLAVDYLSAYGYAETGTPKIEVDYVLGGKRFELVFLPQQSHVSAAYSLSEKVTIYADQLWAYTSGVNSEPTNQYFKLVVIGHLVKIP